MYRLDGKMSVSCDAETVKEKQRTGCSPSAKIIAAANKKIKRKHSRTLLSVQIERVMSLLGSL